NGSPLAKNLTYCQPPPQLSCPVCFNRRKFRQYIFDQDPRFRAMKYTILFILAAFLLSSCSAPPKEEPKNPANVKRHELKGRVVSVDKAKKTASIDHEEVPGYMDAMTMDFPIKEDHVFEELKPGVEIQAELVEDNTATPSYWLEKIAIISAPMPGEPTPEVKEPEQIGKQVPDFSLTDQDGKK